MFQFLNPIWLFAMAAVAIPVAIHLWNIRPGKILKIGSVSLIDAASRKSSRSFKLLDIPLFILRCLMLLLLALVLSIPVWHKKLETAAVKGWILVPKATFKESYQKFKPTIDSLNGSGYELHYFDRGFSKTDLKQALSIPDSNSAPTPVNYWNLARQLDTTVTSALPLYIFTPNQLAHFTGQKPEVALNLHWQTYFPADSNATWIAAAWFNNANNIKVLQGNSTIASTTYTYVTVPPTDQVNSPFMVNINNAHPTITLRSGSSQQPVAIDTTTLSIAIYTDKNSADAEYLKAALQAASPFIQQKISIKQYNNTAAIPPNQSWVFWLSDKPVGSSLVKNTLNLFTYESGKVVNSGSWLTNSAQYSVGLQQSEKIALFKQVQSSAVNESAVWHDGFGHAVLSVKKQGESNSYHFYSRFNPTWNDLVWSNDFPSWMLKLLVANRPSPLPDKYDKRVIDVQQLTPQSAVAAHRTIIKTIGTVNLINYFWLALVLLFIAERWLAHQTQNTTSNG